jgi:hypothetical protein
MASLARFKTLPGGVMERFLNENADDDYIQFVRGLGLQDSESVMPEDEDEEEDFRIGNLDDDDDEDEEEEEDEVDDEGKNTTPLSKPTDAANSGETSSPTSPSRLKLELTEFDAQFYHELEEELGSLEEEDLEAAVASLLGTTSTTYAHVQNHESTEEKAADNYTGIFAAEPQECTETTTVQVEGDQENNHGADKGTPIRKPTGMRVKATVTPKQVDRLQTLLNRHYQLLIQQAVLAIQAAQLAKSNRVRDKTDFLNLETGDDLIQVLDAAVGMVQDLDQVGAHNSSSFNSIMARDVDNS